MAPEFFKHKKYILPRAAGIILAVFCCIFQNAWSDTTGKVIHDSITISLITCYPGPEIYELCGHSAIRVHGTRIDSVWNYGTFDFAEPNFIYRFVKGETDYILSSYPFEHFTSGYMRQGRKIVEQDLNLTAQEAQRFYKMLQKEALPENCKYRYNYVKDNCATRILDRLGQASSAEIIYPDSIRFGTFRKEMRFYHRNYPWYQFGIDLALGSGIDYKLRGKEEMFVPVEMMQRVDNAHFADGRNLVKDKRILFMGVPDATLEETPFWKTPLFLSLCLLLLCILIFCLDLKNKKTTRWIYSLYFGLTGIAGTVIAFLVFVSQHEATSPNVLLIWLNPLQFILAIGVWFRIMRPVNLVMAYYNAAVVGSLLLVWIFQSQSANPAFFPLMICSVLLGTSYAATHTTDASNSGKQIKRNYNKTGLDMTRKK